MKTKLFASLVFTFALFLIAGQSAYSQGKPREERPSPEQMAKRMTDKLDEELDLTDTQYDKVYSIIADYAESHTRESFDRDELNEKIKPALTAEQVLKLEDVLKDMPPPGKRRGR